MNPISSTDNPIFKHLKSLTTPKGRAESNMCIIDGEKLVNEHKSTVDRIFTKGKDLTPQLFNQIAIFETDIIATIKIPSTKSPTTPFLILDRIQDPGNLGTLLRTAVAFGYRTVYTIDCADPWSQKSIRSAMGSQFKLNIQKFDPSYIETATLYIADLDGVDVRTLKNSPLRREGWTPKADGVCDNFGLILGNEGRGVSPKLKSLPHTVITIPTQDVDSLNVAVAGGIIMHALKGDS